MSSFIPFDRSQPYLLPPDLKSWLPTDDMAHFIVAAVEAAFAQVLLLARETGLLRLGVVSIDGTKIDADASKYRSLRYDRIRALREQLAVDIAKLMEQAEHADATDSDPQALLEELARRETLKAKLDETCARLEADAKAQAEAARPAYEKKKAVYDAKIGRRGRAPKPPDDEPHLSGRSA
ncbi:hypothetical protein AA0616_2052 [Komagataeibacter nataicola NRIC 0616]|nr:hypothetical protein AA0616_2052 [Komagataeibacter nataicola NRIC 0616]